MATGVGTALLAAPTSTCVTTARCHKNRPTHVGTETAPRGQLVLLQSSMPAHVHLREYRPARLRDSGELDSTERSGLRRTMLSRCILEKRSSSSGQPKLFFATPSDEGILTLSVSPRHQQCSARVFCAFRGSSWGGGPFCLCRVVRRTELVSRKTSCGSGQSRSRGRPLIF